MTKNECELPQVKQMYELAEKILGYDLKKVHLKTSYQVGLCAVAPSLDALFFTKKN